MISMLLTVKDRQRCLKALGFYDGAVDGLEGRQTSRAYADLQAKYFIKPDDVDGKYGKNTDILLRSAYNCRNSKYFKLLEFRCKCGGKYCTGFPAEVDINLILGLNKLRAAAGGPLTITSGLRCKTWNTKQGGASASRHTQGKAADITGTPTSTPAKRKSIKATWMKQRNARYTYCQEDTTKYHMGSSVHVDVK